MGATPNFAFPYPEGSDPVADGDNAMQALAEAVDAALVVASETSNASNPYSGSITASLMSNGLLIYRGDLVRANGSSGSWHVTGVEFSEPFQPGVVVNGPATQYWNSTDTYQLRIGAGGVMNARQTTASTQYLYFNETVVATNMVERLESVVDRIHEARARARGGDEET